MRLIGQGKTGQVLETAKLLKALPTNLPIELATGLQSFDGQLDSIRFATILFADIVGSTAIVRALDLDDARDLIDESIALVQSAIHDFGGLVVRVQGDGVMAVFGCHPTVQDHALRAALAGLQIVDRMKKCTNGNLPTLQARVGIHAGPILLRWQDHDFGKIVDVVGHAAHIAGKIEQLAAPGSVAISAATASLIAENCDLRPCCKLSEERDDRGATVFELVSINFAGGGCVPVKGNATYPIIGRDHDLEQVRAMIAALPAGRPAAMGFIGDAGMGKSRLLLEASRLAAGYGVTFVVIRGHPLMATVPFGCLSPAVSHLIELLLPFCADPAGAAALSADQTECLDGFIQNNDTWLPERTPGDRNRIATQTIVGLMRLAVDHLPLLILIDDMQYIDRETRSVLAGIRRGASLGIIAAGRPEAVLRITTLCGAPTQLKALSQDAAHTLISVINSAAPLADETVTKILTRADGLPLALQEFAVTAQFDPDDSHLPARLENLLAERLAALDEDAMRLCHLCAALGPSFPASQLANGAALVCRNPATATTRLIDSRVIETAQSDIVSFTHQLVQEAAYAAMPRRRRKAMHTRALELLESDGASQSELADHAEKAGLPQRALDHLWKACAQALRIAAIGSVLVLYRRARHVAAKLDPAAAAFQRARFALMAHDTLQHLSLEREARDDIHAVACGEVDMGPRTRTVAQINMALLDWSDGSPDRGAEWLAQAEARLDLNDSVPHRTYADLVGAFIAHSNAQPVEAIARIERLGARLDKDPRGPTFGTVAVIPHIAARAFGAWYLTDLGDVPRARKWIAEAIYFSRLYCHDYSRLLANLAHGRLHYRQGRIEKALVILRKAHSDCLGLRFYGFEPASSSTLALCLIEGGRLDEAALIINASVEMGYYRQVRTAATYFLYEAQARLAMAMGNEAEAGAWAAQSLAHCRDCNETMHELHALVLVAEVRAAFSQPMEPLDSLRSKVTALNIAPLLKRLDSIAITV